MAKPGSEYRHKVGDVVWVFRIPDYLDPDVRKLRARLRYIMNAWNNLELTKRWNAIREDTAKYLVAMAAIAEREKAGETVPKEDVPKAPPDDIESDGVPESDYETQTEFECFALEETIGAMIGVEKEGGWSEDFAEYKAGLRNDPRMLMPLMMARKIVFLQGGEVANGDI